MQNHAKSSIMSALFVSDMLAEDFIVSSKIGNVIQEVPAFRDFWFQRVIMKCGDHEFRGLFLNSVKPQNPKNF